MKPPVPSEGEDHDVEREEEEWELDDDPGLDPAILRRRRELVLTFVTLALIIAVSAFTAYHLLKGAPDSPDAVRGIAEQAIRNYFGDRAKVQFRGPNETYITAPQLGVREVMGSVVAVTPSGAAAYYRYRCVVADNDGRWEPERLDLMPD